MSLQKRLFKWSNCQTFNNKSCNASTNDLLKTKWIWLNNVILTHVFGDSEFPIKEGIINAGNVDATVSSVTLN